MFENTTTKELAHWIDTETIANAILEELEEHSIYPTLENGKELWLDFLGTELLEGIRSVINHNPAFNDD